MLLLGAGYFAVFGGEYDIFDLRRVRVQQEAERARADEERAEVERLRARRDSLASDPATIERYARERYGLVRPGEVLYRFEPDRPDSASAADSAREDGTAAGAPAPSARGAATTPRDTTR